jgi:membrane-associated phospholipid phosphatase
LKGAPPISAATPNPLSYEAAPAAQRPEPVRPGRVALVVSLWLIAIAIAAMLDRPVAEWVHAHGWDVKTTWSGSHRNVTRLLKLPGDYLLTVAIAAAVCIFHRQRWRAAGFVLLAGVVSGVNGLFKWIVGRHRPVKGIDPFHFDWFVGGITGLFKQKDLCFPSGHACLAFATATALAILLPRWRWWFYFGAALVAAERIFENANYVSDAVAGAAMGVLAAHVTRVVVQAFQAAP